MAKRNALETLRALRQQWIDDDVERLAAMPSEQVEAELQKHGVDVEADRAKGRALLEQLSAPAPPAATPPMTSTASVSPESVPDGAVVSPEKRRGSSWRLLSLMAATLVAAGLGSISGVVNFRVGGTPHRLDHLQRLVGVHVFPMINVNLPMAGVPAEVIAADLRRAAASLCDDQRFADCLERLNQARRLDPAGDAAPSVQRYRRLADARVRDAGVPSGE